MTCIPKQLKPKQLKPKQLNEQPVGHLAPLSAPAPSAPLTFGSLFTGIGGLDLGLERAGLRCAWQVEIEDYPQQVLARHWPDVPKYRDVCEVGAHNLAPVDVIAGGFPCQDISNSGKRKGIEGERSGLWKEYYRLICELRPRYVLVENVEALRHRGRGLFRVLGDLAQGGYDAQWDCINAGAFGAPHLRERIFVVAYARSQRRRDGVCPDVFGRVLRQEYPGWRSSEPVVSIACSGRSYRGLPPNLRVDDGLPYGMERVKGCGNAVAVPVAEHVGRCLVQFHVQFHQALT